MEYVVFTESRQRLTKTTVSYWGAEWVEEEIQGDGRLRIPESRGQGIWGLRAINGVSVGLRQWVSMRLDGGRPVGSEHDVELSCTGLWWRVGTSEIS